MSSISIYPTGIANLLAVELIPLVEALALHSISQRAVYKSHIKKSF